MPRAAPILSSFNAGELSPNVEGRVDITKYGAGAKILENFLPIVQGPAKRRAGTRFVAEVKDSTARTWLVRFEFNTQQGYVLEFGNKYIRFFSQHGQVVSSGTTPYEITSPWTSADLTNSDGTFGLRFTESNDIVYICHQNYAPRKLARIASNNWTMSVLTPTNGPFKIINTTVTTAYATAQTGAGAGVVASSGIFTSAMVGSLFYLGQKSLLGIPLWEAGKAITVGLRRRSNGINYVALTAATTGGNKPIHTSGAVLDGDTGVQWQYEDPGYGYGIITNVPTIATSAKTITNAANNGSGLIRITATAHGFSDGDAVTIANVVDAGAASGTSANGTWTTQNATTNTFELVGSTFLYPYVSGGDISYLFGAVHVPVSGVSVGTGGVILISAPGHGIPNGTSVTITGVVERQAATHANGSWFVTGSTANTFDLVGSSYSFAYVSGGTASSVPGSKATITIVKAIPFYAVGSANASTLWANGAWSDVEGWPSQVNFYKERLVMGRGQNVWLSVSGDYENFASKDESGNVVADMAISLTLQSDKVNNLQWMSSNDALLCGTAGGEFAVQSITTNLPFGPDNVTAPAISSFGSRNMVPVKVGEATLFVQRSGIKLRDVVYDYISNKFNSADQNVMADHITQGGLTQIAFQQEPYSIVWAVRSDGRLLAMTYSREQFDSPPYGGWHNHPVGGTYGSGPAIVESVAVIPAPAADKDEVWLIVKRTINGVTKRYVEYLEYERRFNDDPQDAFYVDCGLTLDNSVQTTLQPGTGADVAGTTGVIFTAGAAAFASTDVGREIQVRYWTLNDDGKTRTYASSRALITGYTSTTVVTATILQPFQSTALIASGGWRKTAVTITGLSHLEGQTVAINGDGATYPQQVVTGGSITLSTPAGKAQIGLPQRARLQTMRLNAGAGDGTSQGKTARINKASVRLLETLGCKFGPSFTSMDEIDFRAVADAMDGPPALFTGDQLVDFDGDYSTNPWVCLETTEPQPCTVIAIMPIVSTYDRS